MQTGGRKIHMLKVAYFSNLVLAVLYIAVMYALKTPPDPLVVGAAFAALGAGHSTANLANGNEHKNKEG